MQNYDQVYSQLIQTLWQNAVKITHEIEGVENAYSIQGTVSYLKQGHSSTQAWNCNAYTECIGRGDAQNLDR